MTIFYTVYPIQADFLPLGYVYLLEGFYRSKIGVLDVRITKQRLKNIIEEEVVGVVEDLKKKKKKISDREKSEKAVERVRQQRKRDDLKWGGTEMRQLARGIMERNPYHQSDGTFSSKKDAKSYSTYFVDGVRKSLAGSTKSVKNSGRGPNNTQGKWRLKDNTPKWESKDSAEEIRFSMTMQDLSDVVEDCVAEFIRQFGERHKDEPEVMEGNPKINWTEQCQKRGFRSYNEILKAMNSMALAADGKLAGGGGA